MWISRGDVKRVSFRPSRIAALAVAPGPGSRRTAATVRTQGGPFSHFLMQRKDFYADAAAKAAVLPI